MTINKLKFLKLASIYCNDPPPVDPPPPPANKTFTQADIDKLMVTHKKELQTQNQKLAEELTQLKEKSTGTEAEKAALQERIDALTNQGKSKEQQLAQEAEKWKKKHADDVKSKEEEAVKWKGQFENYLVKSSLLAAADKHKAESAEQIEMMFKGMVKVVPVADEAGVVLGYQPVMTVKVPDAKDATKKIEMQLPVEEAIAKIKEDNAFANLFKVEGVDGRGSNNHRHTGPSPDITKMPPDQYRKLRKERGY